MFSKFIKEVTEKAERIAEVVNGKIIIHRKGEVADAGNRNAENFIRNTNMKYFGVENNELMGDFMEITFPYSEEKDSFIRIEIEMLYKMYQSDGWEKVTAYITESIEYAQHIENSASNIIDSLESYEKIKDKLIIRPLNYTNNRLQLDGYVYKKTGDIALVLYAVVLDDEENGSLNTIKIPEEIVLKWNIDRKKIFRETIHNTYTYAMPRIFTNILNIENTSEKESAFMASDYEMKLLNSNSIPLITTTRKTNGAIAMFYPGVKEKIAEMFNDSFYVAFTSIHEAMIHKRGTIEPADIKRHIRATNSTFGPEDTLTNEVFYYNKETGTFEVA